MLRFIYLIFLFVKLSLQDDLVVVTDLNPSLQNALNYLLRSSKELPKILEYNVKTVVKNRYLEAEYISKVENTALVPKQVAFSVVLPDKGFITSFIMEMDGKSYKATVKDKLEAENIFKQSLDEGTAAAHVSIGTRNSFRYSVNINMEAKSNIIFHLLYEQLLERKNGQYEIITNLQPEQFVENLSAEVFIQESEPLSFVRVPLLRSGNTLFNNSNLTANAKVKIEESTARVQFKPGLKRQLQLMCSGLGGTAFQGFAGQLVVEYDVQRDLSGGSLIYQDGYFVNFFAPNGTTLEALKKHVIFVLDTSGSMDGDKIVNLQKAMTSILPQLQSDDLFNIIDYNSIVNVWNFDQKDSKIGIGSYDEDFNNFKANFPMLPTKAWMATKENIDFAKEIVNSLIALGGTNIYLPLQVSLFVLSEIQTTSSDYLPLIVFLTDGDANEGLSDTNEIISRITAQNQPTPDALLFTLSFGEDAKKEFLIKLAGLNKGRHTHIFDAEDSVDLLQDFFATVRRPLLSNVNFNNIPQDISVTKSKFPAFFDGSELVVVGTGKNAENITITAKSRKGLQELHPKLGIPLVNLERVWAYTTIQHLLEQRDLTNSIQERNDLEERARQIALKYSFVTQLTSMVVVQPMGPTTIKAHDAFVNGIVKNSLNDICKNDSLDIWTEEVTTAATTTSTAATTTSTAATTTSTAATTTRITTSKSRITTKRTTTTEPPEVPPEAEVTFPEVTTRSPRIYCNQSRYGCCKDGKSKAMGTNFQGCDPLPHSKSCKLAVDQGKFCYDSDSLTWNYDYTIKWYFNETEGMCLNFYFKGCGGNDHRFNSLQACQEFCQNVKSRDRCFLPKSSGRGTLHETKWYYDQYENLCKSFNYFGDYGTSNRFNTEEECNLFCKKTYSTAKSLKRINKPRKLQEKCFQPKEIGIHCPNSNNYTLLYYFDKDIGKCEKFFYAGCNGNSNRFRNLRKCHRVCVDPPNKQKKCFLPPVKGKCNQISTGHSLKMFYYDPQARDCYTFDYSGCFGNANRFGSRQECLKECSEIETSQLKDVCDMKMEIGDCYNFENRWYYDKAAGTCKEFIWSGCGGNKNNFVEPRDCYVQCMLKSKKLN